MSNLVFVRPVGRVAMTSLLTDWFGKQAPSHYFHNSHEEVYCFTGPDGRYLLMASPKDDYGTDLPLVPTAIIDTYGELIEYVQGGGYTLVH